MLGSIRSHLYMHAYICMIVIMILNTLNQNVAEGFIGHIHRNATFNGNDSST